MFLATRPLERTFSLSETEATYRERNGHDRRLWENLARDLLLATPSHLTRFIRSQNWIEHDGPNHRWMFPAFLSRVVENTCYGNGNHVYIESFQFRKLSGRNRYDSLIEHMSQLEIAWDHQFRIIVAQSHRNRNRPNDFCVTFYATHILHPKLVNFTPYSRDLH